MVKGFTLIEILVVIGISLILFTVVVSGITSPDYLENSVKELVSRLRLGQNMAQSGYLCCGTEEAPVNYALEFLLSTNNYAMEAEYAGASRQNLGGYLLSDKIEFKECSDDQGSYDPCRISWPLPDGQILINEQEVSGDLVLILENLADSETAAVIINPETGNISSEFYAL